MVLFFLGRGEGKYEINFKKKDNFFSPLGSFFTPLGSFFTIFGR